MCARAVIVAVSSLLLLPAVMAQPVAKEPRPMLSTAWREGPEYPLGIQEAVGGVLAGRLIVGGGFTRSPKDVVRLFPDAFDGAASGFTKLTFSLDPRQEQAGWVRLADLPGSPRQGAAHAVVGDALYAVGGFNYSEPLTYRETYRLRQVNGVFAWEKLPALLPFPLCEASAAAIGTKLYVFGGGDYYRAEGAREADFHPERGRTGEAVGRALLVLDTANPEAGWARLADLPGTPRIDCGGAAAAGRLYVLGGVYAPQAPRPGESPYYNVVDSWVYDPPSNTWSRLPDMPHGGNRRALTYLDRYLVLVAGYKYARTWNLDGSVSEVYSAAERARDWKTFFEKTVLVYDTLTGELGTADPLLEQTSWPTAAIAGDTIYSLGGEGGARLWHPATVQIGRVSARP